MEGEVENTEVENKEVVGGRKQGTWLSHVKKTMKANKGKSFKQVLKLAKKTYKKTSKKTRRNGRR